MPESSIKVLKQTVGLFLQKKKKKFLLWVLALKELTHLQYIIEADLPNRLATNNILPGQGRTGITNRYFLFTEQFVAVFDLPSIVKKSTQSPGLFSHSRKRELGLDRQFTLKGPHQ